MSRGWRTVRVFLSSTFRDMHAERDHLVKVVFPALRERLEPHRVHLADIDLRWGVTREQAENARVLGLCLEQIDGCRPFFVGILGERYGWVPDAIPDDTAAQFAWLRDHPGTSVTELEILHAMAGGRGHIFFYFRDPAAVDAIPDDRRADFVEADVRLADKLRSLKERIRASSVPLFDGYPACWEPSTFDGPTRRAGRLGGLGAFGERVLADLWPALVAELGLSESPREIDPLEEEADAQERFMESRLRVYMGRDDVQQSLFNYANSEEVMPLLVTGTSGLGKSSALAMFVMKYRQTHPDVFTLPHFVGAGSRSSGLRDTVRRLALTLKTQLGLADEVPDDTPGLVAAFRTMLITVPSGRRVVLVVDAVNQFDAADRELCLLWLPPRLPAHVKVVVSCVADDTSLLAELRSRPHRELMLEPLRDEDRREIIRAVPSLSAKTLDDTQIDLLLQNPATRTPLFLLVALEELRGFGSFEQLNDRIRALPREGDAVTALFAQVISRLEAEFDADLVRRVFVWLASSRRGLSERELQDLVDVDGLDGDDLFPVLRQLRPYLQNRERLIDFYHLNLATAVRDRYLSDEASRRAAHGSLADYFVRQNPWRETPEQQRERADRLPPTPRPINHRGPDELVWQLLRAGRASEAAELLTDLEYLEAKAEGSMVFDLADEFAATASLLRPGDVTRTRLELLGEALRRELHFIHRHPTTLFQCLWHHGWWYDCRYADEYYEPDEGSRPEGVGLSDLVERWAIAKVQRTPGFPWLRSLRPPASPLGSPLRAVLRGHEAGVNDAAYSPDGASLATSSYDGTVRLWNAKTGTELHVLPNNKIAVLALAFSPDGREVAVGDQAGRLTQWDARTGTPRRRINAHPQGVHAVCFSPDGRTLASTGFDKFLRLWDRGTGAKVAEATLPAAGVDLLFSPDGRWLVCPTWERPSPIRVFNARTLEPADPLPGHDFKTRGLSFTPDGRRLASAGKDHKVRVWDFDARTEILRIEGRDFTYDTAFAPDGRSFAYTVGKAVHLYSLEERREVCCFRGHESDVFAVAFAPGGDSLLSGSNDRTLRIWDLARLSPQRRLRGHEKRVTAAAASPDGNSLATGSDDGTIRIWQVENGRERLSLGERGAEVRHLLFAPKTPRLLAVTKDDLLRAWSLNAGTILGRVQLPKGKFCAVAMSPDEKLFAFGTSEGAVVLAAGGGIPDRVIDAHRQPAPDPEAKDKFMQGLRTTIGGLAFSPDGRHLATSAVLDPVVKVWDVATGTLVVALPPQKPGVSPIAYSSDGQRLACAVLNATVQVWELTNPPRPCERPWATDDLRAVAEGGKAFPWLMLRKDREAEAVRRDDGAAAAWWPALIDYTNTHPSGHLWMGTVGADATFLVLEGSHTWGR